MLFEKAHQEALNSLGNSSVFFNGKLTLEKNGRFRNTRIEWKIVFYEILKKLGWRGKIFC